MSPSILLATGAYNSHVQQMAQALHEAGALYAYLTAGVDSYASPNAKRLRAAIRTRAPRLDRELNRRRVEGVPSNAIRTRWHWELPRVAANRAGLATLEHHIWERSERALARAAADLLEQPDVTAFFGVEHGALEAIQTARRFGKPAFLAFLSPHHQTMRRWIEPEYARWPELRGAGAARIARRADLANARRDEELKLADWIVTGSSFTTQSLVAAGVASSKILTMPLGGPEPLTSSVRTAPVLPVRFVHVGLIAVHKGSHHLLRAWSRLAGRGAELHLYGKRMLPARCLEEAQAAPGGESIIWHGSVPAAELRAVYEQASVLVMPTLCDGFGQVVSEALAHGLPVITTRNAGAADLLRHGESGLVVEPGNERALAEAMAWCLEHPEALAQMRGAALAAAAARTWAVFRREFAEAILDAVHTAPDVCRPRAIG
jgi:glycosyltransferase involved in cell wall biosynthesis